MTPRAYHVSLFAGIGSIDLAAEREGIPTILTAEIDDWCRNLLQKRFPDAQHTNNVAWVGSSGGVMPGPDARPLMVSGGFPCPDISNAGTKLGLAGARSGLWAEFDRVIRELQPEYVLIENVPALRKRGMDTILNDLYYAGYDAWWDCFPASYFGAPHERDRIWIQARRRDVLRFGGDAPQDEAPLVGVLDRIPRAGRMIDGVHYVEPPQAPLSAVRRGARYPVLAEDRYVDHEGLGLWPTPTRADGTGGPGTSHRRTGGMNLRTAVVRRGWNGSLHPMWVEWLMGLPSQWTDQRCAQPAEQTRWGGGGGPMWRPTTTVAFERRQRLMALGNATVPRVAQHVIQELLRRP